MTRPCLMHGAFRITSEIPCCRTVMWFVIDRWAVYRAACKSTGDLFFGAKLIGVVFGLLLALIFQTSGVGDGPSTDGGDRRVTGIGNPKEVTIGQGPIEDQDDDLLKQFERSLVPLRLKYVPAWQGRDHCGLNCLYALLRLESANISYDRLSELAGPVPPGGFNMAQLKEIAKKAGTDVRIVKGDISRLSEVPPPAIIHYGQPNAAGHFICLVSRREEGFACLDGTSGASFNIGGKSGRPLAAVARQASGYLLLPADPVLSSAYLTAIRWAIRCAASLAAFVVIIRLLAARRAVLNFFRT